MNDDELRSFKPILDNAKDCTVFYLDLIFWSYRHSNSHQDLLVSERKVQYAVVNDVHSFSFFLYLWIVKEGKRARHDVTRKIIKYRRD